MDRDHILSEIRRTADANGGIPLGRSRFQQATGIRESDWAGKFWLRWSEAIQEAGYEPNAMNPAYDDEFLLSSLAELVRELGHFPLANELAMKSASDPAFPSPPPFRRFGRKGQRAARLVAWCDSQDGWGDVKTICAAIATPEDQTNEPKDEPVAPSGFVYLLKSGRHYKIGRSNSTGRRHYEVALQLPQSVTLVHEIATDDPPGIERYWHERFADRRCNGEWFELRREDVSAFRRRKFM